jgi:hypothetical protein
MHFTISISLFFTFHFDLSPCSRRDIASHLLAFLFKKWTQDRYPIGITPCNWTTLLEMLIGLIDRGPQKTHFRSCEHLETKRSERGVERCCQDERIQYEQHISDSLTKQVEKRLSQVGLSIKVRWQTIFNFLRTLLPWNSNWSNRRWSELPLRT